MLKSILLTTSEDNPTAEYVIPENKAAYLVGKHGVSGAGYYFNINYKNSDSFRTFGDAILNWNIYVNSGDILQFAPQSGYWGTIRIDLFEFDNN